MYSCRTTKNTSEALQILTSSPKSITSFNMSLSELKRILHLPSAYGRMKEGSTTNLESPDSSLSQGFFLTFNIQL